MSKFVKVIRLVSPEDANAVVRLCVSKMIQHPDPKWTSLVCVIKEFLRQTTSSWSLRFEIPSVDDLNSDFDKALCDNIYVKRDCVGDLVTQSRVTMSPVLKFTDEWYSNGTRLGYHYSVQRSGQKMTLAAAVIRQDSITSLAIQSRACLGTVWCHANDGCLRAFDLLPWREGTEESEGLQACIPRIRECMRMDSLLGKRPECDGPNLKRSKSEENLYVM